MKKCHKRWAQLGRSWAEQRHQMARHNRWCYTVMVSGTVRRRYSLGCRTKWQQLMFEEGRLAELDRWGTYLLVEGQRRRLLIVEGQRRRLGVVGGRIVTCMGRKRQVEGCWHRWWGKRNGLERYMVG